MKIIILLIACVLCAKMVFGQSGANGNVTFIPVNHDKNIKANDDTLATDMFYIIDGDESKGEVVLNFTITSKCKEIYLIVNIPDREWAETNDGFEIFYADKKLATVTKAARNSWLEIKLDNTQLPNSGTIELHLKSKKNDGLYICSQKSGKGAVLKVIQ